MGKILDLFRHGTRKTRIYLIFITVILAGSLALGCMALIMRSVIVGVTAGIMLIIGVTLITAVSFSNVEAAEKGHRDKRKPDILKDSHAKDTRSRRLSSEADAAKEADGSEDRETVSRKDDSRINETEKHDTEAGTVRRERTERGYNGYRTYVGSRYGNNRSINAGNRIRRHGVNGYITNVRRYGRQPANRAQGRNVTGQTYMREHQAEMQNKYLKQYDKETIKKLIKVSKTGKENVPVIIDSCPSMLISKCPAYVWISRDAVNFLLLEKAPRTVTMTRGDFKNVSYMRRVEEKSIEAYRDIEENEELKKIFGDAMPAFNKETVYGRTVYMKNQYILGRDMAVTPKSMRLLKKKYSFNFSIFESVADSRNYSEYFKEAFETKTLLNDGVIDLHEYQQLIRGILQRMTDDGRMIKYDFEDNLMKMVQYRLITGEYADYYKNRRELLLSGKKKGKRR